MRVTPSARLDAGARQRHFAERNFGDLQFNRNNRRDQQAVEVARGRKIVIYGFFLTYLLVALQSPRRSTEFPRRQRRLPLQNQSGESNGTYRRFGTQRMQSAQLCEE